MATNRLTYEQFLASARFTHYDNLTEDERSHAPNYEGCEVAVFEGGPALCKHVTAEGEQWWFEDYKERFTGSWDEITRQFYEFLTEQDALSVIADDDFEDEPDMSPGPQ